VSVLLRKGLEVDGDGPLPASPMKGEVKRSLLRVLDAATTLPFMGRVREGASGTSCAP